MNILARVSKRNIEYNKQWSIMTILGLILSTAMITAVIVMCFSFYQMMMDDSIKNNGTNQFRINAISAEGYNALLKDEALAVIDTDEITRYTEFARQDNDVESTFIVSIKNLRDDYAYQLKRGTLPANDHELVVSPYYLETLSSMAGQAVDVGTTLPIRVAKSAVSVGQNENGSQEVALENPEVEAYTIVGVLKDIDYSQYPRLGDYVPEGLLTFQGSVINYNVTFNYKTIQQSILADARNYAETYGTAYTTLNINESYLNWFGVTSSNYRSTMITSIASAGGIVLVLILAAGISLINNAFSMAAAQRSRQLGMLGSVGATRSQKRTILYSEGLFLSVVGITLGIGAGYLGMAVTFKILADQYPVFASFGLKPLLPWQGIVLTALFALVMVFLSLYRPARRASKVSPVESIRESKEYHVSAKKLRVQPWIRQVFKVEGEIASKYMKRNKRSYRPTIISLTISIILFLAGMNLAGMMTETIELNQSDGVDITLYYNEDSGEKMDDLKEAVQSSGYFSSVVVAGNGYGNVHIDSAYVSSEFKQYATQSGADFGGSLRIVSDSAFSELSKDKLDPASGTVLVYDQSFRIVDGKGISSRITELKEGDLIQLYATGNSGTVNYKDYTASLIYQKISGLTQPVGEYPSLTIIMSEQQYKQYMEEMSTNVYMGISVNVSLVLKDKALNEEAQKYLQGNELTKGYTRLYDAVENNAKSMQMIGVITVFVSGFIGLISLICLVNIINTMSNAIRSRRKEFAILRSVGMDSKGINRMLYYEAFLYGIKTIVVSIPISLALNWFIHSKMNEGITVAYGISWIHYVGVILLVMGIVLCVMLYISRSIKKENIIETIKNESY